MKIKHLILTFLLIGFGIQAYAQFTAKGNFILGGTLGFSTATSDIELKDGVETIRLNNSRNTQFNISPKMGYFVTNNFALGIGMDYTLTESKEPKDITDPNTDFSTDYDSDLLFGPFARGYFPVAEDMSFFLEAAFGFGSSRDQASFGDKVQTISTNVFAVGVGPGITVFSSQGIGIEALVKYNFARSNNDVNINGLGSEFTTWTNQVDFSVGFQFYFGGIVAATANEPKSPGGAKKDRPSFY